MQTLTDLERLGEEKPKVKEMFFAGRQSAIGPQITSNRSKLAELSRSFVPKLSTGPRFPQKTLIFEEGDKDDINLRAKFRNHHMDTIDKRITIGKIKERSTILKNVNTFDEESAVSEEEQVIFKKVTSLLESHLADDENHFKVLINKFQEYLVNKYNPILTRVREGEIIEETIEMHSADLCKELNDFTRITVRGMILYYNFDVCNFRVVEKDSHTVSYLPCTILNFDNLMNFTTVMMFPPQIYSIVLEFMKAKNFKKDQKFKESFMKNQRKITMTGLGVDEKFRLQETTNIGASEFLRISGKYSHADKNSLNNPVKDFPEVPNDGNDDLDENKTSGRPSERKLSEMNTETFERKTFFEQMGTSPGRMIHKTKARFLDSDDSMNDEPYRDSIRTLRYIAEMESPFEKMKVLLMVIRRIIKTINDYYSGKKQKTEVLTGDQIMSLTVYVVLRAKCEYMFTYIEFIETFLPPKMFNTFCGYYLTVFHAACEYIAEYK